MLRKGLPNETEQEKYRKLPNTAPLCTSPSRQPSTRSRWCQGAARIGATRHFVEDAYEEGNGIEIFGADCAKESADLYEVQPASTAPPRGALVFYNCRGPLNGVEKNWGHVGLSCGDGNVIHARDRVREDDYRAVEQLQGAPGWTSPRYIDWALVERILRGHITKGG